jgi:superfamily II DNA or RNA helicase
MHNNIYLPLELKKEISLRDYQQEVINLILESNQKTQLYVLPTGAGKTVIFSKLTEILLKQNKKVLILAHRNILIEQIKKYNGLSSNLMVETKQSYSNRLNFNADYVIIDEAHNIGNSENSQYKKIIDKHKDSVIIGFTATPTRLDNGLIYGTDKLFKKVDFQVKPIDLINQGYLVPYKTLIPFNFIDKEHGFKKNLSENKIEEIMTKKMLIDAVTDSYVRFSRKKTLIFATSIKHSEILQEELFKKGIFSKTIHSNLHKENIKTILRDFSSQYLNCLINVNMLTEGFDEPQVDTLILARPTTSISLHRQIIGRGLRLFENKEDCLIVDLVGNFNRLGDINDVLQEKEVKKKAIEVCPVCILEMVKVCEVCGFSYPKELKEDYEKIRNNKELTSLVGEDFKVLDLFAKKLNMQLVLNVHLKKTSSHLSFIFQVREGLEDGSYNIINFTMNFTQKSIYFLKNFLKKFDFKNINNEEDSLDYLYLIAKSRLNNFKLRYIEYSFQENDGKKFCKINKVI